MKKVFVFGTGKLYKKKEDDIKKHYDIVGFFDNKVSSAGVTYEDTGIPIYPLEDIMRYLRDDICLILMSYQYVAMLKQLYELGIGGERILFGIALPPFTESEEILFEDGRYLAAEDGRVVYYLNSDKKIMVESHGQLQKIGKRLLREKYRREYPIIDIIAQMDAKPISRSFGIERGKAIDRYYIENFLEENRELIRGDCLEIAENTYTLRYGKDKVERSYMLHLKGWGDNCIKGNLETGEGIESAKYDCAIITQTLMFIFDTKRVAANIYRMLKKGGSALLTVSGISQISRYDADLWGSYYGFHEDAMRTLFEPLFGKENVTVHTYGNVKTAMAMLCGLCQEDLCEEDFRVEDKEYPVIVSCVLKKK